MNFQKLDLNLLIALEALLTERHVGRAAERLHVSQPTMSVALAKLREHYNDELLIRDGRSMAVTPFAANLSPLLHQFLADARLLATFGGGFDPGATTRHFVIIAGEGRAGAYMPGFLRSMREAAPSATLSCIATSASSVRMFNEGEVDLLLIPGGAWVTDEDRSWTERHPNEELCKEPRACIAWSQNTRVGDPATLDQIRSAGVVIPSFASNDWRPPSERPLDRYYGTDIPVVAEMPSSAIAGSVVGTGLVGILGRSAAAHAAKHYDLKLVRLPKQLDRSSVLQMYWHRRNARDPAITWLKTLLRAEVEAADAQFAGAD